MICKLEVLETEYIIVNKQSGSKYYDSNADGCGRNASVQNIARYNDGTTSFNFTVPINWGGQNSLGTMSGLP